MLSIVCIGVSPPLKNTTLFSSQAPPSLKLAHCLEAPAPFLGNPPLYWFFGNIPHPKSCILQWTPKITKFFILNTIYLLKVTKFLLKMSQFECLVTTEKNVFAYKLFLSLNISDFNLFFIWKLKTPEKVTPSFPATPL